MSTVTCVVLVKHKGLARKYTLADATVVGLKEAVSRCPLLADVVDLENHTFQVYDKGFQQWVNLIEGDTIQDMAQIKVMQELQQDDVKDACVSPPALNVDLSGSSQERADGTVLPPVSAAEMPGSSKVQMDASFENCVLKEDRGHDVAGLSYEFAVNERDDHGHDYMLPNFDQLEIFMTSGLPLTSSLSTDITEKLFQSVIKHTLYPSKRFFLRIMTLFIQKYPALADVCGTGYDSWLDRLRNKLKNERRKVTCEEVQEKRQQYGHASRKRSKEADTPLIRNKVPRTANSKAMDGTEDATSLSQHEKWLCVEGRKESADEGQILVRMEVTRSARAASLAKLSVLDATKKYPYLMTSERFLRDFEMLVNREALSCIQGGLDKLTQCVLQGTLPCKRHHLQSLLESAQHRGCKRRKTHVQAVQVLRLLTVHVKEKKAMDALFLQASSEDAPTPCGPPCIIFHGKSLEDAEHLFLHAESTKLFRVIDVTEGLAAVMAAYWIFNIQYAKGCVNTASLIERLFFNLNVTKLRPPAITFLNKFGRFFV